MDKGSKLPSADSAQTHFHTFPKKYTEKTKIFTHLNTYSSTFNVIWATGTYLLHKISHSFYRPKPRGREELRAYKIKM
jgi:hypothetical protein